MEFWGIEVKPGQVVKCDPGFDKYLHLTQASLGEMKKDKGSTSIPLFVNVDDKKLVIGTLSPDNCAQITYDLVFEQEFELSHGWKNGSVFFVGYQTIIEDDPYHCFSDIDSEEEMAQAIQKANVKSGTKGDPKAVIKAGVQKETATASKGKPVVEPLKQKPDDSDEEDESDDDDMDPKVAIKAGVQKENATASKGKPVVEPLKQKSDDSDEEDESDDDDEDESGEEDDSDQEMSDSGDEDESSEEEKATPKQPEGGKKRQPGSDLKTSAPDKKLKLSTSGWSEGKKSGHVATPHPAKQSRTPALRFQF